MAALSELAAAFEQQLTAIRSQYGSAWAVFIDGKVEAVFPGFDLAADYAYGAFGDREYLIRHTDQQKEFVPFLMVDSR